MLPIPGYRPPASSLYGTRDVTQLYPFEQGMTPIELRLLQVLVDEMAIYDEEVYAHARRMVPWAHVVSQRLHLSSSQTLMTCLGALLHDIGKRGIPFALLHKSGPLDQDEWALMRQHADIGYTMLMDCGGIFASVAPIVRAHHERWNGSGYPLGLAYESIPLSARIISVLDSYDAMTSRRPYAPPRTSQEACLELLRCAGSYYQPLVVAAALPVLASVLAQPVPPQAYPVSAQGVHHSLRRNRAVSASA